MKPSPLSSLLPLLLLPLLGAACVSAVPEGRSERALLNDLTRVVETREAVEWFIDQEEIDALTPAAMRSTCRVLPERRLALDTWITQQIEAQGGPSIERFNQGVELGDLDETLTLERVQRLLQRAHHRSDECPFWLRPEEPFTGVSTDEGHLVLLLESSGSGALVIQPDRVAIGGGGGGRLLGAWGAAEWLTIGLGAEVGGQGLISEQDTGEQDVAASLVIASPLLLRFIYRDRLYDLDLALVNVSSYRDFTLEPGVRVHLATGLATNRTGWFLPTGVVGLEYEYQPGNPALPETHFIRVRSRFGVDVRFF